MDNQKRVYSVLPAMILPFAGAWIYFVLASGTQFAMLSYTAVKCFTVAFPLIAYIWIEQKKPFREPIVLKEKLNGLGMGIITGSVISLIILGAYFLTPLGDIVNNNSGRIKDRVSGLGVIDYYIPFCLFISLIHSLIEEYFWRWYVYGNLKKIFSIKVSHILAAIAFSLHHFVILGAFFPLTVTIFFGICVGIGGLVWSLQYEKYKNLTGSWVSHIIVDLCILGIGYFVIF